MRIDNPPLLPQNSSMETTAKSYKFIGRVLPDGHLSLPQEAACDTGKEFEVIMRPLDDAAHSVSLYLEGKLEKRGRIEDLVLPRAEIEAAIERTFGSTDIDEILRSVRR